MTVNLAWLKYLITLFSGLDFALITLTSASLSGVVLVVDAAPAPPSSPGLP